MLRRRARTILYGIEAIMLLITLSITVPYRSVEPRLTPYVTRYMSMIKKVCRDGEYNRPHRRIIGFGETRNIDKDSADTIGWCMIRWGQYRITIDEPFFNGLSEDGKFQLMAHELTHCVLGLDHRDDVVDYMNSEFVEQDPVMVEAEIMMDAEAICKMRGKR